MFSLMGGTWSEEACVFVLRGGLVDVLFAFFVGHVSGLKKVRLCCITLCTTAAAAAAATAAAATTTTTIPPPKTISLGMLVA